jgi:hypothetical protein
MIPRQEELYALGNTGPNALEAAGLFGRGNWHVVLAHDSDGERDGYFALFKLFFGHRFVFLVLP